MRCPSCGWGWLKCDSGWDPYLRCGVCGYTKECNEDEEPEE